MQWLLILMLGLVCAIGGVVWGLKRWQLRRNGVRTMGTVVELSVSMDIPKYFTPVVEFKTGAGHTIRFRGSTGSESPSYQRGELVKVLYSRQNPSNAQIDNFEQLWLGPVSIGLFGLIALGAFFWFGKH